MLGTELRDFKGEVRCIDNLLRDSRNFISKNHSILPALFRNKFVKHYRTDIVADEVMFVDSKSESGVPSPIPTATNAPMPNFEEIKTDDDLPF